MRSSFFQFCCFQLQHRSASDLLSSRMLRKGATAAQSQMKRLFHKSVGPRALPALAPFLLANLASNRMKFFIARLVWRTIPRRYRVRFSGWLLKKWSVHWWTVSAFLTGFSVIGYAFYLDNLERVPFTHRRRLLHIPTEQLFQLCRTELQQIIGEAETRLKATVETIVETGERIVAETDAIGSALMSESDERYKRVRGIVDRIVAVIEHLGISPLPAASYKLYIVNDDSTWNAHAMPDGSIVVFTGVLESDTGRNTDELAMLLGHEMAHVVLQHSAEKFSRSALLFVLDTMFWTFACGIFPGNVAWAFQEWVRNQFVHLLTELPFSRALESEADFVGLILAAKAGFDTSHAPNIWRRRHCEDGANTPLFFNTHPNHECRQLAIENWRPLVDKTIRPNDSFF